VIATLCENLDSLDEPEARAAMIWIVGEYAERIDNADELLESFLDGFHDESTQVSLQAGRAIPDCLTHLFPPSTDCIAPTAVPRKTCVKGDQKFLALFLISYVSSAVY